MITLPFAPGLNVVIHDEYLDDVDFYLFVCNTVVKVNSPRCWRETAEDAVEVSKDTTVTRVLFCNLYPVLKWIDLLAAPGTVTWHALYGQDGVVMAETADSFAGLRHNAVVDAYAELYEADLDRAMLRLKDLTES